MQPEPPLRPLSHWQCSNPSLHGDPASRFLTRLAGRTRGRRVLVAAASASLILAAANGAWAATPEDPYEASNRQAYAAHFKLDRWILAPLARLYHALTPGPIGKAIHNVVSNLSEPIIIANDVLQFRLKRALHDTLRVTANSTAGILGLMDVATPAGLPHQDNDFGITLGRWGVGPGPYLFIPLVGPTTVRDAIGVGADVVLNPLNFLSYPQKAAIAVSTQTVGGLDVLQQHEDQLHALLADAADPYATLRSVYLQSRAAAVSGEDAADLPVIEDEPSAAEPAPPPADSATPPPPPAPGPSTGAAPAPPAAAPDAPAAAPPNQPAPGPRADADHPDPDAVIITARDWRPDVGEAAVTPANPSV
jgi:phospholipid-binding lipoprotein MlaA